MLFVVIVFLFPADINPTSNDRNYTVVVLEFNQVRNQIHQSIISTSKMSSRVRPISFARASFCSNVAPSFGVPRRSTIFSSPVFLILISTR
ncbi:hypothetical protein CPB84DRAFT_1783727 [Gymnopilus junonius]|uniref:Secreted protein n=1 Tax=Gymnopilus junonius TaxID=109634 RepID=A0A9P5NJD2_GYMJU|nr:hypothetical protein CPB84DRAFT_1783727 [Gymnopilus junonius]